MLTHIEKVLGSRWWTSATDAGCPGKMAWCGSGVSFAKTELSLEGEVKNLERCVALKRPGTLSAAFCAENNRPLCEVHKLWKTYTLLLNTRNSFSKGFLEPKRLYSHRNCPLVQCKLDVSESNYASEVLCQSTQYLFNFFLQKKNGAF
jgi:hypothetical protein